MVKEKNKNLAKAPLYVINIDASDNTIIVGEKNLEIKKIKLRELNLLALKKEFDKTIKIKVRSTGKLLRAKIFLKTILLRWKY